MFRQERENEEEKHKPLGPDLVLDKLIKLRNYL